jgi:cytochrome c peroxidase
VPGKRLACHLFLAVGALPACTSASRTARQGGPDGGPVDAQGTTVSAAAAAGTPSAQVAVGRALFFDPRLSASGAMSCATCHDPAHAYGPPDGLAVQLGGPHRSDAGRRAVPSLRYKEYTPHYADLLDNPDGVSAPGPGGGFAWDGRADTLADQAKAPLLSPFEMANASPADVVSKVRAAPYAQAIEAAFGGPALWSDAGRAFDAVLRALQAFQLEDPSFHPYTSKWDLHSGNKIGGDFTPAERRGFTVFIDAKSGNCASCHYPGAGINGSTGVFTDFSFEAIGVPRNAEVPANADPAYFDLGLCGPLRTDHTTREQAGACGLFKTPTLRNVATRAVFFHNGFAHSLEQALRFYNTRDTDPELWYPRRNGAVAKFDDLPQSYRGNLDRQMPLDGRAAHSRRPMTDQNLRDLVCFLETLTDDYRPPATPPKAGRCVD